MKSREQIQRAHDLITNSLTALAILEKKPLLDRLDRVEPALRPELVESIVLAKICGDVLCWVLNHDHETNFATNLEVLRDAEVRIHKILQAVQEEQEEQAGKKAQNLKEDKSPPNHHPTHRHKHRRSPQ